MSGRGEGDIGGLGRDGKRMEVCVGTAEGEEGGVTLK